MKIKKMLAIILSVAMLICMLPMESITATATTSNFAGGSGTENDPYLISTKYHLNNVRNDLDAHYKMIADVEFTDEDFVEGEDFYNDGKGWLPIGKSYPYFTGFFDGNGFTINNLTINANADKDRYLGFFAINKGTIKNVGLKNCDIRALNEEDVYSYIGGIVGYNYGTVENCYTTGSIISRGEFGSSSVGGIAGCNSSGTIKECYNMASVTATNNAGGITSSSSNGAVIENCFNTGFITANKNSSSTYVCAGGISGYAGGTIIKCCYNVGQIVSSSTAGWISTSYPTKENCYYLDGLIVGNVSSDSDSIKCTVDHMKSEISFGGFDFQNVWTMGGNENYLYPELLNAPIEFEKQVHGITLSSLPYKTEYYVGLEELDVTGGKIAVLYNDGTYEEIDLNKSMVSGFDNSKVETQTLTVSYNNQTLTFEVKHLPLVYDYKFTTDEIIKLELSAKKDFEFVLSDEKVARIASVQSSLINWGSTYQKTSAATIEPLKPGYVILRAVATDGNILASSLLLIEEGNHRMQVVETLKEATCTEIGKEIQVCKFCGYIEEVTIPYLNHTLIQIEEQVPTCTEKGHNAYEYCTECDYTTYEETPEIGHTEGDVVVENNIVPTCTQNGSYDNVVYCMVCSEELSSETIIVDANGHSLTQADAKEPTCTEIGWNAYEYCTVCDYTTKVEIPALGHDTISVAEVLPQTNINGTKAHDKCTECGCQFINGNEVTANDLIIAAYKWVKGSKGWWYDYGDGTYAIGWEEIDGVWYYFNANGYMQTGWKQIGKTWYYFKSSGAMVTDWQKIGGVWYYFKESGAMATGWFEDADGTWYYFNASGAMQTGWEKVGNTWYYFNTSGAMKTGWLKLGGTWYYFTGSGAMVTGSRNIGGKVYRFNASGACLNP